MKFISSALLSSLVLMTGCSKPTAEELFTTAQNSYQELQKAATQQKSVRDSLGAIAIDGYKKVVKEYPSGELAERATFMVATIQHNDLQDFVKAIDSYNHFAQSFPTSKQAPVAMFLVGYLYNNELHNLDSAAAAYRRFLEKFPDNEMAMSAQFELNNLGKSPDEFLPKPAVAETPAKKKSGSKSN